MSNPRSILRYFLAVPQGEGMGAQVRRSIGTMKMRNFPPFLMLDHFRVTPPAGFPDHPHRGFSTVTLINEGMMAHEDFTGSAGVLKPGDLQFMTAGRGIVHSEIPVKLENNQTTVGLQLWVDLPAELKECEPEYADLKSGDIPVAKPNDKVTVKVIAGEAYGAKSTKGLAHVDIHFYDYYVSPGGEITQNFPTDFNVFIYVLEGELEINGSRIEQYNTVFFKRDGDNVTVKVPESSTGTARFVLIGGELLTQPIVQHGPFVATSKEKIYEAFMSYQSGVNGFEKARGWNSKIGGGIAEKELDKLSTK